MTLYAAINRDTISAMRFTLPKLFLAVTLAALACAGMFSPTHRWASSIVTLTIALFAFAALRSMALDGRERVFALTFSVVGFAYLGLVTAQPFRALGKGLITNYSIALLAASHLDEMKSISFGPGGGMWTTTTTALPNGTQTTTFPAQQTIPEPYAIEYIIKFGTDYDSDKYPLTVQFFLIGHCVWSWIIALCAAWMAGRMHAKRREPYSKR